MSTTGVAIAMHKDEDPSQKSRRIRDMFSAIAPRYDLLNRFLSFGIDQFWRRRMVNRFKLAPNQRILDVATGTADVALEFLHRHPTKNLKISGIDFSWEMLKRARIKNQNQKDTSRLSLAGGLAEALPYRDDCFDGITVAFGVRNFADVEQGIREMFRVLKPGAKLVVLEFSLPEMPVMRSLYGFYFNRLLPWIGQAVSGHSIAYRYLPDSVGHFPVRGDFVKLLEQAKFMDISFRDMTLGIVTLYEAVKGNPGEGISE